MSCPYDPRLRKEYRAGTIHPCPVCGVDVRSGEPHPLNLEVTDLAPLVWNPKTWRQLVGKMLREEVNRRAKPS